MNLYNVWDLLQNHRGGGTGRGTGETGRGTDSIDIAEALRRGPGDPLSLLFFSTLYMLEIFLVNSLKGETCGRFPAPSTVFF